MKRLLTSCFGLGWLPVAPGTWGSLPPALLWGLLGTCGVEVLWVRWIMGAVVLSASAVCVLLSPAVVAAVGREDPGEVVADEVAGQAVVFCAVPAGFWEQAGAGRIWLAALAGFLLFRLFDVTKPGPIRRLEKLSAGWGILADDLLAGLCALGVWVLGLYGIGF